MTEDGPEGTEAINCFCMKKRFTLHTLSVAEEPGSFQPKEFIAFITEPYLASSTVKHFSKCSGLDMRMAIS